MQRVESKPYRGPVFAGLTRPVLVSSLLFMVVAGIGYPLATTAVAQLLFPNASDGSLIERDGAAIGSSLIGQNFTRPDYFHSRPSATTGTDPSDPSKTIDQPYNAALSGASNLGPTSKKLTDEVSARAKRIARRIIWLPTSPFLSMP